MSIVVGPIVRHTNRKIINVWVVVDRHHKSIELRAYRDSAGEVKLSRNPTSRHVKLGTACYAVLVSAALRIPADCERIYYDIVIDSQGFKDTKLNEAICFLGENLPSLMVPKKHQKLLQASCRKPHDSEGIDQLGHAAKLIQKTLNNTDRPSQLFLTGDQIYADDVSPILLHSFQGLRRELGIETELAAKNETKHFNPELIKLDNRGNYLKSKHGFTSGEKSSHLVTFSEYLCMYLFGFSGLLPGQKFASYKALQPHLSYSRGGDIGDEIDVYRYGKPNYEKDEEALGKFAATAGGDVRKVLANISVYMIFDDHEVTDDWNLTEENQHNLRTSPIGKQVQINALSAYLLCQHWGNQPDGVTTGLLNGIQRMALNPIEKNRQLQESLWDRYWGYTLDQKPPVTVLDTRTHRVFSRNELALISPKKLHSLGEQLQVLGKTPSLVVVSPTPVYGFTEAEIIQLRLGLKLKTFVDREPWIASNFALQTLQLMLSLTPGIKDIIIFSGDVHYAFSRRQTLENPDITMWQLCSSAASNSPIGGNNGLKIFKKVVNVFQKEHTPYLVPRGEDNAIITSDKNIEALTLDAQLRPIKATLHCCSPKGKHYTKVYDLLHPKEYTGSSSK